MCRFAPCRMKKCVMNHKICRLSWIVVPMFLLLACSSNTKPEPTDTPTSGDVNIVVDASFQPLFETQIFTFETLYKNAHIHVSYQPEVGALQLLMNDSCKVAVMSRDLSKAERKTFEANNIFPISTKIAEDAVALLVHPDNVDSVFSVAQIKDILLGNDTLWKQVNLNSDLAKIEVVFDHQGSANARYMQTEILDGAPFGKTTFAVNSNEQVIDYVSQHKNAIGFISVNWISDMDDPKAQAFLSKVNVVAISKDAESESFEPYQAYIQTKEYPFTRSVYLINRQTRAGLGMGFASFVAGDKGQLMVLKSGMVPAIAPVRLVHVNME